MTMKKIEIPTPHGDKLRALAENSKLPKGDAKKIKKALSTYETWLGNLARLDGKSEETMRAAVELLNEYRLFIDLEVIFESSDDFLYRQKGQLKLDNSVIEEFIPHLVSKSLGSLVSPFQLGPQPCYSGMYFSSTLSTANLGPGLRIRSKDQDFTISRKLTVSAAFDSKDSAASETVSTYVGYLCAECKTNLDKTMFQEAIATAHDVKTAVPGAKYLLLCEWLDMTPISPAGTDIDEVLILRKARRVGAQIRGKFSTCSGRGECRPDYEKFLRKNPFSVDVFERLVGHVRSLLENKDPDERDVLGKGYF